MTVCFVDAEGNLLNPGPKMIDDNSKKATSVRTQVDFQVLCQNLRGFTDRTP